MVYKDKQKRKEYRQGYYQRNKERLSRKENEYYKENRERIIKRRKERYQEIRREVLIHYGGGKCSCISCGFSDERALSIDHINNDGAIQRKITGVMTPYSYLKSKNFPEGFQTLCMNCQFIKQHGEGK